MSTITVTNSPGAAFHAEKDRRAGLLRRVFQGIIESRRMSSERKVGAHLEGLSDTHLFDLGLSAAEIETIRAGRWHGRA
jgi:uncharacterized protein YjiS (DUF1127 family)